LRNLFICLSLMAKGSIETFWQAVRSVLDALQIANVEDGEFHDLTLHIGYTGL
jgi:hypothetical protein